MEHTMIINREPEEVSPFSVLNAINVNGHTEKKNGLTYLSWAWAWGELLKCYPDATYTVYENKDGWNYHTDGKTCWVKTGVTVEGKEYIEMLPVMDFKNKSIPLENVTSMDVNKAIQRSLTKAVARHGLGLYIYAGEDLPEGEQEPEPPKSRSDIVRELCKKLGIEEKTFGTLFQAGKDGKVFPAVRVNELSDADFKRLLEFVEAHA